MKILRYSLLLLALLFCMAPRVSAVEEDTIVTFRGTSDTSAVVMLDDDLFIAADDENNTLRVYTTENNSLPVQTYDLTAFLHAESDFPESDYPEADIEAAARVGSRIYWITSHGRNKNGKLRPNRYCLFATDFSVFNKKATITPVGYPYRMLAYQLVHLDVGLALGLAQAAGLYATEYDDKDQLKELAPKNKGLNIEGLCASPQGDTLYVGLRNPRYKDEATGKEMAIVIVIQNPDDVVRLTAAVRFGEPLLWDLQGLGIRAMEYSPWHRHYFIVAGPHDDTEGFFLYKWFGKKDDQPELMQKIEQENFTPESIGVTNAPQIWLFSDDGTVPVKVTGPADCKPDELIDSNTCPNKFLTDQNKKTFKAIKIRP